jgi:hypothetical protein
MAMGHDKVMIYTKISGLWGAVPSAEGYKKL